jgi:DNA-binding NarL/FixJ family response regulator
VIGVLIVDDHPAVRAGVVALLRREPGIVPVGAVQGAHDAMMHVERTRPDVALLDYALGDGDGIALCYELRSRPAPPSVLLYSAFADDRLAVAARVAGSDGVVSKGSPADELCAAIRAAASGRLAAPRASRGAFSVAGARLHPADLPILGMLNERVPRAEISEVLGLSEQELDSRTRQILARLVR